MFVAGWFGLLTFPVGLIAILAIARQHLKLRKLPTAILPAKPATVGSTQKLALITPLPEPHQRNIRNSSFALKLNLVALIPGIFFFGGIGLCVLGEFFVPRRPEALRTLLLVFGGIALGWGAYTALYCLGVYEDRWVERRLRAEIQYRPDALVESNDPDAVCASLIPRENWSQVNWTMSSDLFLVRIDPRSKEVLLEGDSDRYQIPAGAIADCEPQRFFHPVDTSHKNELWMVRLMINASDGMRELLLWIKPKGWWPRTNASRRRIAEETCERINDLRVSGVQLPAFS